MTTHRDPDTVHVEAGERFTIALSANPTTGYVWTRADEGDGLPLVEERMRGSLEAAGAAGVQEFSFDATVPGMHVIRFVLKRAWEAEPLEERSVTVTVTG